MKNIVVQVVDSEGGTLTAQLDEISGFVNIESMNGRTGIKEYISIDPNDEVSKVWLQEVFPPTHLDILLGRDTCEN